jgi:hypothetical protein
LIAEVRSSREIKLGKPEIVEEWIEEMYQRILEPGFGDATRNSQPGVFYVAAASETRRSRANAPARRSRNGYDSLLTGGNHILAKVR